jgi:hypothetical protein
LSVHTDYVPTQVVTGTCALGVLQTGEMVDGAVYTSSRVADGRGVVLFAGDERCIEARQETVAGPRTGPLHRSPKARSILTAGQASHRRSEPALETTWDGRGSVTADWPKIQSPWQPGAILGAIDAAGVAVGEGHLKAGYAYATAGGVQLASWALEDACPGWAKIRKQWLISLDWGTTEPEAIELLMALPNSSVRIPNAAEVIKRRLMPRVCFHPKVMVLHARRPPQIRAAALVVGSGNLTITGLRTGYEAAALEVVARGAKGERNRQRLDAIARCVGDLNRVWREAETPDAALLDRYRELRRRRPAAAEDATPEPRELERAEVEQTFDRIATLATASHLWVNAGYVVENLGRGRPGNQIDLARGTRAFFGFSGRRVAQNTMLGSVRIRFGPHLSPTNMRFANNKMDRLNLPLPGESGPNSYDDEWLLFDRRPDGSFTMTLLDPQQVRAAKRRSREQGSLFKMRSGREYGVYRA